MKFISRLAAVLAASIAFGTAALAQTSPTLTFTAELVRGVETVTPKLTWSTSPAASSCTATGDTAWAGTKAAAGTETLAAINVSKSYVLSCTWNGDSKATATWTPPTTYTNGAPLTVATYKIYFGTSLSDLLGSLSPLPASVQVRNFANPALVSALISGITTAGTYFFCVKAADAAGIESPCGKRSDDTSYPSKIITSNVSDVRTVSVMVDPRPSGPTNVAVQ